VCRVRLYKTSQESCTPSGVGFLSGPCLAWCQSPHARTSHSCSRATLVTAALHRTTRTPRTATRRSGTWPNPKTSAVRRAASAQRRRRRPRRVGPSGFVCGRHVDRGDEHMSPRAPPSNPGRHAHRAQTQGRHTGVRPRAPDIACPPHTPCIKIMINILRALKRRWILIVAFQSLGATRCRFLSRT